MNSSTFALLAVLAVLAASVVSADQSFCQSTDVRNETEVQAIRASMDAAPFSDEKVNLMVWGVRNGTAPLSPEQLVYLLKGLTFSSSLQQALTAVTPWLWGFTVAEFQSLLSVFTFSSDKMDALTNCKDYIREDEWPNRLQVCTAFTFSSDQQKCRDIMNASAPFTCTWGHITALKFNVAVDVSGSMATTFNWNGKTYSRLSFVTSDLNTVVRTQLKTEQMFNLFSFSTYPSAWQPGLVAANDPNIDSAVKFISGFSANGCTNTYDTLRRAFQDKDLKAVYLLSDGEPTCGTSYDKNVIIQAAVQWSQAAGNIPIHTVAMTVGGSDDETAARAFMKTLAQKTGGSYRGFQ